MSAVLSQTPPLLRSMREADLPAVMAIERAAYEFPWTMGIFRDCLRFDYICHVYEEPQGIVGYGIMSIGAGECHLLNLCIHPRYQGRGLGGRLIEYLLHFARARRARTALLEVRVSNPVAYRLYTKIGFNEIGRRPHYYPTRTGREDAILLAMEL